jgi:hypothetical protein
MSLDIKQLIAEAMALNDKIKQAVADKEHIIETAKGEVPTGQLVNAASFSGQVVALLNGHIAAEAEVIKRAEDEIAAANK